MLNYFRSYRLIEGLASVPLIIYIFRVTSGQERDRYDLYRNFSGQLSSLIQLLFIFKVKSIKQIFKKMEERTNIGRVVLNMIQLAKLISTIMVIAHFFACFWIYFAKLEEKAGIESWLSLKSDTVN